MLFFPESFNVSTPTDRSIEIARDFNAPRRMVFDAFTKPDLVRRWLLGPDGWTMPVCEIDLRVGGRYRYVWRKEATGTDMGMGGVFREIVRPEKLVATEKFDDAWYPGEAVNTTIFVEERRDHDGHPHRPVRIDGCARHGGQIRHGTRHGRRLQPPGGTAVVSAGGRWHTAPGRHAGHRGDPASVGRSHPLDRATQPDPIGDGARSHRDHDSRQRSGDRSDRAVVHTPPEDESSDVRFRNLRAGVGAGDSDRPRGQPRNTRGTSRASHLSGLIRRTRRRLERIRRLDDRQRPRSRAGSLRMLYRRARVEYRMPPSGAPSSVVPSLDR